MTNSVFLSASVPDPRSSEFVENGDTAAIVSAVSSLLHVVLGRRRLVWGGHPAITPLVWAFREAIDVDYQEWVALYQSRYFEKEFPKETKMFSNVVYSDAFPGDREKSLFEMRRLIMKREEFDAGVFIGGMRGTLQEFHMLQEKNAQIVPVVSTGGATTLISQILGYGPSLEADLDYVEFFYDRLNISPNEKRYTTPQTQPARLQDRMMRPVS